MIEEWYIEGASMGEFHSDEHFMRVVLGSRGAGKTTGTIIEAWKHGYYNPGAIIRGYRMTQNSNVNTVVPSIKEVFGKLGSAYKETEYSLFKTWDNYVKVRFPSLRALQEQEKFIIANPNYTKKEMLQWITDFGDRLCSYMTLDGLPDWDTAESKVRSNQASLIIFFEGDQFDEDIVKLAIDCVRVNRDADGNFITDIGVILESNPPTTEHWLVGWEYGTEIREKEPDCKFWHIHIDENAHYWAKETAPGQLSYADKIKRRWANDPEKYKRYVEGKYADVYEGTPAFPSFSHIHAKSDLPIVPNSALVRGWDYGGSNNSTIWAQYWMDEGIEYFWALKELWLQNSNIDLQCQRALEITNEEFPVKEFNAVYDFGDVAGGQKTALGSVEEVMGTYGVYPSSKFWNIAPTLSLMERLFQARDKKEQPVFLIDKVGCPKLYKALAGQYRYPKEGEPGYGAAEQLPLKGAICGNADHVVDALRYSIAGLFRLTNSDLFQDNSRKN